MSQYRINTVQTLVQDINRSINTTGIEGRHKIASAYEIMMNVDNFFPKRPQSANRSMYQVLREGVSDSCPACYSTKEMLDFVDNAKQTLREYKQSLENWLVEHDSSEPYDSIHDLKPTI